MRRLFSGSGMLWRNSPIRNDHFSCVLYGAEPASLEPSRTSEGVILYFRSVKCAGHAASIFIVIVCFLASSRTHSRLFPFYILLYTKVCFTSYCMCPCQYCKLFVTVSLSPYSGIFGLFTAKYNNVLLTFAMCLSVRG